jgi:ABC-type antimicrobial peptide transport system permease subunit
VLLGVAVGIATAYQMGLCMQPLVGYAIRLEIPPLLIAGSCAAALATVLLAAWRPARRAARLDLLAALQYE